MSAVATGNGLASWNLAQTY